jgi:hypothetical protein
MCAHDYTHLQLGRKHESKDAKRYTYQTQTVKPVFMSDSTASVTELIAAGHCVPVPHVAGVGSPPPVQALWGIQHDTSWVTDREMRATGNTINPD